MIMQINQNNRIYTCITINPCKYWQNKFYQGCDQSVLIFKNSVNVIVKKRTHYVTYKLLVLAYQLSCIVRNYKKYKISMQREKSLLHCLATRLDGVKGDRQGQREVGAGPTGAVQAGVYGEGEGCVQSSRQYYFVWSVYPASTDQYRWRSGGVQTAAQHSACLAFLQPESVRCCHTVRTPGRCCVWREGRSQSYFEFFTQRCCAREPHLR